MNKTPLSIAIINQAHLLHFLLDFAAYCKKSNGTTVHVYCEGPESAAVYEPYVADGTIASVNVIEMAPIRFPENLDEESVIRTATRNEKRFGRPMNWYSLVNRHFGRGYAPQGFYHPRSQTSQNSSYVQYLDYMNKMIDFWDAEFITKKIDVFWNASFVEADVARAHGARTRTLTSSRYKNLYYWATDEYWDSAAFALAYENTPPVEDYSELESGPYGQGELAKISARTVYLRTVFRRIVKKLLRYAYVRYKGYPYQYYLIDELKLFVRQWWRMRRVTGTNSHRLCDIENKRFVFFPLQVEPERNFQGGSPEYFYQHSAIVSVARDLPAGVILAVKEHFPAVARRTGEFYKQITELKNVVLLDVHEPGVNVIKKAVAVATINSTAGMEAAIIGKPVITFGRHNIYNVIPHVSVIEEETQLRKVLATALSHDFDTMKARSDGARFVKAIEAISVDMKEFSYPSPQGYDDAAVSGAYDKLVESMAIE